MNNIILFSIIAVILVMYLFCASVKLEIIVAVITGLFAIIGFLYNGHLERKQHTYELKSKAYAIFLEMLEKSVPKKNNEVLSDADKIRQINASLATTLIYAPDNVIKDINEIFGGKEKNGRVVIQKIELILHNDLYDLKDSPVLKPTDFPFIGFDQEKG